MIMKMVVMIKVVTMEMDLEVVEEEQLIRRFSVRSRRWSERALKTWPGELNYHLLLLDLEGIQPEHADKGKAYVEVLEHYSEGTRGEGKVYLNDV